MHDIMFEATFVLFVIFVVRKSFAEQAIIRENPCKFA